MWGGGGGLGLGLGGDPAAGAPAARPLLRPVAAHPEGCALCWAYRTGGGADGGCNDGEKEAVYLKWVSLYWVCSLINFSFFPRGSFFWGFGWGAGLGLGWGGLPDHRRGQAHPCACRAQGPAAANGGQPYTARGGGTPPPPCGACWWGGAAHHRQQRKILRRGQSANTLSEEISATRSP